MVDAVYRVSLQKDPEETSIALFWDDFPNGKTLTGGGHWESILRSIMTQQKMSLIEGARVYAELFITMQDAAIGCFKAKYTYNLLRPVTYVQKYMHQENWQPLIVTPPHPEYPAAHATVSMSAATILTRILGENVAFTDNSYAYRNYPARHYNNFVEAGREAGISRFYGGIHYMPSIEAGFIQGTQVAEHIFLGLDFKTSEMMGSR
jgi:membrane-associated phospholipid phosphatase